MKIHDPESDKYNPEADHFEADPYACDMWSHAEPPRYDYRFKLTPVVPLLGRLIS